MGSYRFSIYLSWQFGIYISYEPRHKMLTIIFTAFEFIISFAKYAKGFHFENELK